MSAWKVIGFLGIALIFQGCEQEKEQKGGLSCADNTKALCTAVARFGGGGTGANAEKKPGLDQTGGFPLPSNIEALCEAQDTVIAACQQHCTKYETRDSSENTPLAVNALRMCLGKALIVNNLYQYSKDHCAPYITGVCAPEESWTPAQKAAVQADSARQDSICNSDKVVQQLVKRCEEKCVGNHDEFKECVATEEDGLSESLREQVSQGAAPADVAPQNPQKDTGPANGATDADATAAATAKETPKTEGEITDVPPGVKEKKGEDLNDGMTEAMKKEVENEEKATGAAKAQEGLEQPTADLEDNAPGAAGVTGLSETASHISRTVSANGETAALS